MIAKVRQNAALREGLRSSRTGSRVIVFPLFERYGDQIRDWLTAIDGHEGGTGSPVRVVRSMRRTAGKVDRVRNSLRHSNLASFLRHAANALDAEERDGARYILTAALALPDFAFHGEETPGPDVR